MEADLCQIYQVRLGAPGTLVVTGWAAIQGVIAGRIDESSGADSETWAHEFGQHFGGAESGASSVHEATATGVVNR